MVNLKDQKRIHDAIRHWEQNTNLRFVERSHEPNYVYFDNGKGCLSYVAMIGGRQTITLSEGCSTGSTIHEIGHAVGLWHEQSSMDREDYLTINYENIEKDRDHNFMTYSEQRMDGSEYTNTLDFGSIMIYGSYAFSKNGKPTLVKKDGRTFQTNRSVLSPGDRSGIEKIIPFLPAKNRLKSFTKMGIITISKTSWYTGCTTNGISTAKPDGGR